MKPETKPRVPNFGSGPCCKRPGWDLQALNGALVGRSHRCAAGRARLREVIERSKALLGLPSGYLLGIVPGSDTGAVEMALWSLLGQRGADVLAWESFGKGWVTDVVKQLRLKDVNVYEADYGEIADLAAADFRRDVVFAWNGTTSGVRVPDGDWIAADREGLTICDATSAIFAMPLPWEKLDVVTYSWQKVLGGEAAHGVIILSPRAVERLESYQPPWPMPKVFRLTKAGRLNAAIFEGDTINTPSMLCTEDALDGLKWAASIGGLSELYRRSQANFAATGCWVESAPWVEFLARRPETRSTTSMCLQVVDPWLATLPEDGRSEAVKQVGALLETEGVGYDILSYREAPVGLRLWGGATVETADLEALFPWLDWAWAQVKAGA